jgi:nucleotide-binding universal stress UspA family protein
VSTILIGVDASERSEDAIALGRRLASASGARVELVCVFPYDDSPNRAANAMYREYLAADAEKTITRLRAGLDGLPDEQVATRIVANYSPPRALHAICEAERPAVVVVGSTHTGHLGRVSPGSTGERLLHGSPCPVVVAPQGYRTHPQEPIRRIGVGVDGSAESDAALAAGTELACALGAHLEVIGVHTANSYGAPAMMGGPGYDVVRRDIERRQKESLAAAVASVRAGADAEAVPLAGDPAKRLIERSAQLDLLIVGSRGYGPLRSVLVGGVSGEVVRGAHCPVIAVPRGVEAPLAELFTATTSAA